jgi:hypothetical protein
MVGECDWGLPGDNYLGERGGVTDQRTGRLAGWLADRLTN